MSPDVGNPGEGEGKAAELEHYIDNVGQSYQETILTSLPNGNMEEIPILKAIFCERTSGQIDDLDAMRLAEKWINQIKNHGGKIFLVATIGDMVKSGLLTSPSETHRLIGFLDLSADEESILADELKAIGWKSKNSRPGFTAAWSPTALRPESARTKTVPGHPGEFARPPKPAPADTDTEEHDPRGFIQRHVGKIAGAVGAAAALAYGAASLNLWNGSENGLETPPAAAASEIAGSPEPTPPKAKTASLAPTPTSAPSTPPAPVQKAPVAKAPTKPAPAPIAPRVEPKPTPLAPPAVAASAETPAAPAESPKIANFPIVTRQNALGATFIDVEASSLRWKLEGWKVTSFLSPDGNKGVMLTKNGKTAKIGNLRIAAGIEVLGLNLD